MYNIDFTTFTEEELTEIIFKVEEEQERRKNKKFKTLLNELFNVLEKFEDAKIAEFLFQDAEGRGFTAGILIDTIYDYHARLFKV